MPLRDGELQDIETEILSLRQLLLETQRRLKLQESRIEAMTLDLNRMTTLVAQLGSGR